MCQNSRRKQENRQVMEQKQKIIKLSKENKKKTHHICKINPQKLSLADLLSAIKKIKRNN